VGVFGSADVAFGVGAGVGVGTGLLTVGKGTIVGDNTSHVEMGVGAVFRAVADEDVDCAQAATPIASISTKLSNRNQSIT
jgi:hypothetical protein